MTQRKLLIGAASLTVAIGAVFFVTSQSTVIHADEAVTTTKTVVVNQASWKGSQGSAVLTLDQQKNDPPSNWQDFWKDWLTGSFPGSGNVQMTKPSQFASSQDVKLGDSVVGKKSSGQFGTVVSSPMQFSNNMTGLWQQLTIRYKAKQGDLKLMYRIADTGTSNPYDAGWQEVNLTLDGKNRRLKVNLQKTGKVFQYAILAKNTSTEVTNVVVVGQGSSATPTPTVNTTVTPTSTSTATPTPAATDHRFSIWQDAWKSLDTNNKAAVADTKTQIPYPSACADDPSEMITTYLWDTYAAIGKTTAIKSSDGNGELIGQVKTGNIDNAYVVSQAFTMKDNSDITWQFMKLAFKKKSAKTIKLYYRTFNDLSQATSLSTSSDWIQVQDPNTLNPVKDDCTKGVAVTYRLDVKAKYIQYKVHVAQTDNFKQQIFKINLVGTQRVGGSTSPTPSVSPTSSVSPVSTQTPTPEPSGNGKITVLTRFLNYDSATPSPSPSASGPALPNLTPSPVMPTVSPGVDLSGNCNDADIADNVSVKLKQVTNGRITTADQFTDEDGEWRGLDGGVDEFPNGNYEITFGDFRKTDYKLVGFCVTPDDGQHYFKTAPATDPATGKVTIIVKPGQETKVIALYGPRTKPFIDMSKFAIDATSVKDLASKATQRVLKVIYPGQRFLYRIKYRNTSDADATNVLIQDVIPSQFDIPDDVLNDDEDLYGFQISVDAQRRTLIKKQIGTIKAGEEGSIYIPVTLRDTAFSQDDSGI